METEVNNLPPDVSAAVNLFISELDKSTLSGIKNVFLFGSYAHGNYHEDSDVDIAVVFTGTKPDNSLPFEHLMTLSDMGCEVMLAVPRYIQPVVLWESQLYHPEEQANPRFYQNLLTQGIKLK